MEKVLSEKGPAASIGDALSLAARDGEVDYVDVTGLLWKDVDTAEDLMRARALYRRINVRDRERPTAGPAALLLVRPLSLRLALATPRGAYRAAALLSLVASLALTPLAIAAQSPLLLPPLAYALALLTDYSRILSALGTGACGSPRWR